MPRTLPAFRPARCAVAAALVLALGGTAGAEPGVRFESVTQAYLGDVTYVGQAPGDPSRLYVGSLDGTIRVREGNGTVRTFLPPAGFSQLMWVAFDPAFATSGVFYVRYISTVVRFRVSAADPTVADRTSADEILRMGTGQGHHDSGWLGFGPDGNLYITRGESSTPTCGTNCSSSQQLAGINGKVLRIDVRRDDFPGDPLRDYAIPPDNPLVSSPTARPETLAYGLRNPFRASFDRLTGDLWIGDVGDQREESNVLRAGSLLELRNLGYPCREGYGPGWRAAAPECVGAGPFVDPAADVPTGTFRCITGGPVYRGTALAGLQGRYFFGTCPLGAGVVRLWSVSASDPASAAIQPVWSRLPRPAERIQAIGEDLAGEMYVGTSAGRVYRLVPDCPADHDGDRDVQIDDLFRYLADWFALRPAADADGTGAIQVADIFRYLQSWFEGC